MQQITPGEAQKHLPDLIKAALDGKKVFIIQEGAVQAVQLVPVTLTERRPQYGSARGLIKMADDFDAALADFDEYGP